MSAHLFHDMFNKPVQKKFLLRDIILLRDISEQKISEQKLLQKPMMARSAAATRCLQVAPFLCATQYGAVSAVQSFSA